MDLGRRFSWSPDLLSVRSDAALSYITRLFFHYSAGNERKLHKVFLLSSLSLSFHSPLRRVGCETGEITVVVVAAPAPLGVNI